MYGKSNIETYITICKIESQQEFAVGLKKLKEGFCINLDEWAGEGDGREFKREVIYVYLWLIHVEVWQKTTKFCKAVILHWKKRRRRRRRICLQCRRPGFNSQVGKIPWRRKCQPAPVSLSGESREERSLAGYSLWGRKSWTWLNG